MSKIKEKFLLVDDDTEILETYHLHFKNTLNLLTAKSAWEALELVKKNNFAVVISDYNLPDINGLELIKEIKAISPDTICTLLTAEAELSLALDAINSGSVYKFLIKPCSHKLMANIAIQALKQYRTEQSEKDFIVSTLSGTSKMLTNVLSILNPCIFSRTQKLQKLVKVVSESLKIKNSWEIEMAALFSQIGFASIPPAITNKLLNNEEIHPKEREILHKVPEIGEQLLNNIPRLENVAYIVKYNSKNFNGDGYPKDDVKGTDIPLESRVLRILDKFIRLEDKLLDPKKVFYRMKEEPNKFDPVLLKKIYKIILTSNKNNEQLDVTLDQLRLNDYLVSNVTTESGRMLFSSGNTVTELVLERLYNYAEFEKLKEPLKIVREKTDDF